MRFNKPELTVKEFSIEVGKHYETVKKSIIRTGKVRFKRNGPKGWILIEREWADEYHDAHTFGGGAYGK